MVGRLFSSGAVSDETRGARNRPDAAPAAPACPPALRSWDLDRLFRAVVGSDAATVTSPLASSAICSCTPVAPGAPSALCAAPAAGMTSDWPPPEPAADKRVLPELEVAAAALPLRVDGVAVVAEAGWVFQGGNGDGTSGCGVLEAARSFAAAARPRRPSATPLPATMPLRSVKNPLEAPPGCGSRGGCGPLLLAVLLLLLPTPSRGWPNCAD
mmetsp:Transcript_55334/g.139872  ORF Transcript_55334/g.139872 Transcript_55334/m.139872 type:complete len:213 (+) Transcript_55334:1165-1803(+)